jgi:DHA1 family inner membrane transport protein
VRWYFRLAVLGRTLDTTYAEAIRRDITTVTAARLSANALYRYIGPFLAVVARGLDVSVAELGVALTIAQVTGFAAPLIGRLVDRLPRRRSIVLGLAGAALGGLLVATSNGIAWFTVGLLTIGAFNLVLIVGAGSWIADHVPFEQRGRVVGINETSWALGLLVGVSAMGLITAATSWRWAYAFAAAGVIGTAVVVWTRLDESEVRRASEPPTERLRFRRRVPLTSWLAVLGVMALMAASESLFITFGPWLKDEFGITSAALAGVTFGLGALELTASSLSATRTDRWGKERSVVGGAAVMLVAATMFVTLDQWAVPGMVVVALFIASGEFSIVSAIPLGAELIRGRPATGLGLILAAATSGRALTTIPTTWLYDRKGIWASAVLAAAWAIVAATAMVTRLRLRRADVAVAPATR